MDWVFTLILGAALGAVANKIKHTSWHSEWLLNIRAGTLGAIAGKLVFSELLNFGYSYTPISHLLVVAFWSLVGSFLILYVLRSVRIFG